MKDTLEILHKVIMENFFDSCTILIKEELKYHEFNYCINTIKHTLIYLESRRKENEKPDEKEHPFPNEELILIMKLNSECKIPVEDIAMISNLLHKYLNLRSEVFHEF